MCQNLFREQMNLFSPILKRLIFCGYRRDGTISTVIKILFTQIKFWQFFPQVQEMDFPMKHNSVKIWMNF